MKFFSLFATSIQIQISSWGFNSHFQFNSILNYTHELRMKIIFLRRSQEISYDKFIYKNFVGMFDSEVQFLKKS